jgi:ribonuclease Z
MIKVTFLGTSAQIPTVKRNHSSILLNYKDENILIDCGEGTQRQFRKARLNPCKITRILITHWHGDHVLGLIGLFSTLAVSGYNKTLFIYGPKGTKRRIDELIKIFNFVKEYEIKIEEVKGKFFETEEFYLEAEEMEHGIPANAYCFVKKGLIRINKEELKKSGLPSGKILQELKKGKDIVYEKKKYSAEKLTYKEGNAKVCFILDTLMNKKIIPFSKDSDLLVCEASFDSSLEEHAKEHKHLTAKQAGEIAKKAKVKKLILTHISQRYEREPNVLLKDAKDVFELTSIAKDLESVEI